MKTVNILTIVGSVLLIIINCLQKDYMDIVGWLCTIVWVCNCHLTEKRLEKALKFTDLLK